MKLIGCKVGIVVAPGFDDGQVDTVFRLLRGMEAAVEIIGPGETILPAITGMRGTVIRSTVQLSRVSASGLDAVIIPGGNSTASLQADVMALTLLIEMAMAGKPIGGISNGVAVLASAGLVAARRVTGDLRIRMMLKESDATFLDQGVVVDHNLVTSQSEENLLHFVDAIAFLLEPATSLR